MSDLLNSVLGNSNQPANVNIPPFTSSGGITPEQQALTQYTLGQNLLADESQFASSGTGESTMKTQATGGARIGAAEEAGKISDVNQGATYQAYRNDVQNLLGNLQTSSTLSNLQQNQTLADLASAGQAAGLGGGSSGGSTSG